LKSIHAHYSFLALTGCYYHQCFLRGIPEITCLILRIPSGDRPGRKCSDGKPPGFDAISREFPIEAFPTLLAEVPSGANIATADINTPLDRTEEVREAALQDETPYGISRGRELPSSGHSSMGNGWSASSSSLAGESQRLFSVHQLELQNMPQHQAQQLPTHQHGPRPPATQYQDVMHSGLPGVPMPMPEELDNQQLELQNMPQHQAQQLPTHQLGLRSTSTQNQDSMMHSGIPGVPMSDELANDLLQYYQYYDHYLRTSQGGFSA